MTQAIEEGIPKMRIEEAAAKKQAKIDFGEDVIVGVNSYKSKLEQAELEILEIDNTAVRLGQIKRLEELKANRDADKVEEILNQLTRAAESGEGNLLR